MIILWLYIDGSCSVDRISCSQVSPVNRQRQSDGYQLSLFLCCGDIVKMKETSNNTLNIFLVGFLTELCLFMFNKYIVGCRGVVQLGGLVLGLA